MVQKKKALTDQGLSRGGGDEEDRTPDLRIANATLSQLSYVPGTANYIAIGAGGQRAMRRFTQSGTGLYIRHRGLYLRHPSVDARLRILDCVGLGLAAGLVALRR